MRITDDYEAKYAIWAKDPKPQPELKGPKLPKFKSRRFNSYQEFNRWKEELIEQMICEMPRPGK